MLVKDGKNKWKVARDFVNLWLKDGTVYCNTCGSNYIKGVPCCDDPCVGRNIDITKAVIEQNKDLRATRKNDFASDKKKTIRFGVSLPPKLYSDLERFFQREWHEKLFNNPKEMRDFAREMPMFSIPKKI